MPTFNSDKNQSTQYLLEQTKNLAVILALSLLESIYIH